MEAAGLVITVCKLKLDGTSSEHTATLIESDAEGCWLFSPAGTRVSRSDQEPYRQPADGVQYFPRNQWFAGWHFAPAADPPNRVWTRPWLAVDVIEPARFEEGRVSFVDLELDLWSSADGTAIVDQEDLVRVERAGLITAETATRARRTADDLAAALEPGPLTAFGGRGWRLLGQASTSGFVA